jgi:ribosome biogenesis GTPase / thiamine phosphate phosphatase
MQLSDLGFDRFFEGYGASSIPDNHSVARVSAVDRGSYLVRNELKEVPAELAGKLLYETDNSSDLPCVGDWVVAQYYNNGTAAIIHRVFPRKTYLRRKSAGEIVDIQMIAANVDTAFIVQSCHFDFNPRRLDRYLVMATDGRVEPVIILTKTDLITADELQQKFATVASVTRCRALGLSSVTGSGFDDLRRMLSAGRTCCLLGSSGVGKTTLINRLIGREAFETKPVSGTGEGTHTTSRRQLILLDEGAMLIDTPGMRELGLVGTRNGVSIGFEDLVALSVGCRYADCSHREEPGCAVRAAVANGELDEGRYSSYLKLKKESEYYEMSHLDKRKKDKAFGRFIKVAKKQTKG